MPFGELMRKNYTPTPWWVSVVDHVVDIMSCNGVVARMRCHSHIDRAEAEANAVRIVACVNACQCVSVEVVESLDLRGILMRNR